MTPAQREKARDVSIREKRRRAWTQMAKYVLVLGALVALPRPSLVSVRNDGSVVARQLSIHIGEAWSCAHDIQPGETKAVIVFRWLSFDAGVGASDSEEWYSGTCGYIRWMPQWVDITVTPESRIVGCL
jgi:hypothetical protein